MTKGDKKPALEMVPSVSLYWGWVRLCRAAAGAQAVRAGTDRDRPSPSSTTPTAALSAPARAPCPGPLTIPHDPMSTGEAGGRLQGEERF